MQTALYSKLLKAKLFYSYILISYYIISVNCSENCQTLCENDRQCYIKCNNSVENHPNVKYFGFNELKRVVSPHCGLQTNNKKIASYKLETSFRVVGGSDAEKMEFPWTVSLHRRQSGNWAHFCAGTVLNDYSILTAAHCADSYVGKESSVRIRLGTTNCKDSSEGITMSVRRAVVHSGWNRVLCYNDIAILHTNSPIKYTMDSLSGKYSINSLCLPNANEEPIGTATLVGWGQTGKNESGSKMLQKIEIPKFPRDECAHNYIEYTKITQNMICFGGGGGKGSCLGDSGGPLVQKKDGRFVLIGIVSFGIPCANKGLPGVYTQVSKYLDWIDKNVLV